MKVLAFPVIASRCFRSAALVGAIALILSVATAPKLVQAGEVPLPIILNLDQYSISHDQHLSAGGPMSVLANDENIPVGFIAVIVSPPLHGTLNTFDGNGNFEYDPPANFIGQDTFLYTVVPNDLIPTSADVTAAGNPMPPGVVEINMTNSPALANDDAYTMDHDTVLNVAGPAGLLLNDFDPDGDPITVFDLFVPASHGGVTVNADGSFQYTPNPGYFGVDTFQYRVTDGIDGPSAAAIGGSGASADAIGLVTITITEPPTPTATATATAIATLEPTAEPTKDPGEEPTATPTEASVEPTATATTAPDAESPVTELPDTGASPGGTGRDRLLVSSLLALTLLALGLALRKRSVNRA